MSSVVSNEDQFQKLADNPNEEPFVMLNLLKFNDKGGREAYFRYIAGSGTFVDKVGAKVLYFGKANERLNGTDSWDIVMLVQYPSRKAFLEMINDPEYKKVHESREQALDRAVLYATDPVKFRDILSDK